MIHAALTPVTRQAVPILESRIIGSPIHQMDLKVISILVFLI